MAHPRVAERRLHPRDPVREIARLIVGRGPRSVEVLIVDRSMTGLRVQLPSHLSLPDDVTLLSVQTSRIYEARVVWKTFPHVGLSIRRTVDMRTANGPETASLRKLWLDTLALAG